MNRRFFTRVDINPLNPEARGICDRCGQQYTLSVLRFQKQYMGGFLQNKGILVCRSCYDIPSEFLKTITNLIDPPAIYNVRSEPYAIDEDGSYITTWSFLVDENHNLLADENGNPLVSSASHL